MNSLTTWSNNKAQDQDIIAQITRLAALPSRNYQSSSAEFKSGQESYLEVLRGVDLGVLSAAISKFQSGDLIPYGQTEQWFPSPASIANQCKAIAKSLSDDRAREREAKASISEHSRPKGGRKDLYHREILARDLSHGEWVSKAKTFPVGSVWEARTGRVYAPAVYSPPQQNENPKISALEKWERIKAKMDLSAGDDLKTVGEIKSGLIAQIGQDEFDKIPDLGTGPFAKLK